MPSSLNQNLDKELAARGGVTRGLGPFLRHAYGESDLRGELAERFSSALGDERWDDAITVLQLDASAGGVLPHRTMNQAVNSSRLAPWLVRAVSQHGHADTLLESMANRPEACDAFIGLVGRRAKALNEHLAEISEVERIAFGAPLGEVLVPPRATERAKPRSDRKIGRNDPCPCGSGKKFKKCHANDPDFLASLEASDLDDAPGLPGISSSEVFWFRHASESSLAELCKRRLETGGPRAGETLFWPVDESPHDETVVRAEIAAVERPEELPELLSRGLETQALTEQQALDQVAAAYPTEGWFEKPPLPLFEKLSPLAASKLVVAGTITASQILLLAGDETVRGEWLETALVSTGEGDLGPLVALARALAQAGRASEAYLLTHHCRAAGHPLTLPQVQRLRALDGAMATGLGNTPLSEADWLRRDDRTAELAALRSEVKRAKAELDELQAQLEQSERLRKRAEEAWAAKDRGAGSDDQLRREVKRLKGLLTQEHDKRRDVERNLETIRRRERARLLKESSIDHQREQLAAEIAEAKVEEKAPAKARHVSYHPDFETIAQRLPPSTVARLRGQIEDLAAGRWVREAKRMEGVGNLWTLRAGIHYRALIREYDDHLDVFALIPREELDTTLARLRS